MYTSLNEWKKNLEKKGFIKEGKLAEDFDGEYEDADFVPAEETEEGEENEDGLTFDKFKDAIIAEHEAMCSEDEDEESENEECEMLDDKQLTIAYNVCMSFCSEDVENDEDDEDEDEEDNGSEDEEFIERLKSTELPSKKQINEIFGKKKKKGASQYQNTIDFIEGDSEEAKKVKEYYEKYLKGKEDKEIKKDSKLLKIMQMITKLGTKWAKENKMEPKDYSFKQIRTVLEEDFDRKFSGGTDVTVGESKK